MNDKQRLIVGFSGMALGNTLLAVSSWLRADSIILTAGQLVVALSMVMLAAGYLFDFSQYEPPNDNRMWELFPTTVVLLGTTITAMGAVLVILALIN
ncbi:hypothetical protein [Halorhabdus sp. SVX81]|uniref:hypothetical protein n=1 Tax=Halorhabdus sp. SVX81 TaxID=2978283 RepID=UPI0023D9BB05|nr:hypothetical protein [Halorhabdus sp. SVX81]